MGESWFSSVPAKKYIRMDGFRFNCRHKGIVNKEHTITTYAEIKSLMQPLPGSTYVVMESVGENCQNIYAIGYKYSSKKFLCFISYEQTDDTSSGKPYEDMWID